MSGQTTEITIDRSRCALCGEPNDCALAGPGADTGERCWCVDVRFPAALRQRATRADGGASCICRRCLEAQG